MSRRGLPRAGLRFLGLASVVFGCLGLVGLALGVAALALARGELVRMECGLR
jgi:hypothetical protein